MLIALSKFQIKMREHLKVDFLATDNLNLVLFVSNIK